MAAPYRRGSGTSMATAAVSGLVAAMLSADDGMTPDRVKFALMATARRTASDDKMIVGSGLLDGYAAMSAPSGLANQGLAGSDGHGSLAASRGHLFVRLDPRANNVVLDGDKVAQIQLGSSLPAPWAGTSWTGTSWTGTSWTGTSWTGTSWTGTSWTGTSWTGTSWTGTSWTGTSWTTNAWYGTSWTGGAWYGAWDQ
jgi:serine protease AprX